MKDVNIQKKPPSNVFTVAAKLAVKQGVDPRTSRNIVFCAIGCATSTFGYFRKLVNVIVSDKQNNVNKNKKGGFPSFWLHSSIQNSHNLDANNDLYG